MSCKAATAEELYRLRTLTINETYLAPKDLHALPNLRELHITINGRIDINAFAELESLETLTLDYTRSPVTSLYPGLFKNLTSVSTLQLRINPEAKFRLDRHIISGLDNLQFLDIGEIDSIASDTFYDIETLKELTIKGLERAEASTPILADKMFQTSPRLINVEANTFRIPLLLNLASPEAACYAASHPEPRKDGWAGEAQLTIDTKPTELLDWTPHNDGTSTCRIIIDNDRVTEVTIPLQ